MPFCSSSQALVMHAPTTNAKPWRMMLHDHQCSSSPIKLSPCFPWKPAYSIKSRSPMALVMAVTLPRSIPCLHRSTGGWQLHSTQHMARVRVCVGGREAATAPSSASGSAQVQQIMHSMPAEKVEVFKSLRGWAETDILPFLKPVDKCWQPQDFLPEAWSEGFVEEVRELRARAAELPDDYLVCVVGDMITEEALPTYQAMINTLDGVRDESGACPGSWARWTRAWTAEENRHGDLLHKYLYLTGRVDMRAVEKTVQYLIAAGMDPRTENNPYLGFMYTSFQERATFISHGNTARQAKQFGDLKLAQICGTIAADERRHENAYCKIIEKLFELDPNDTMICFEDMMRKKITMPAHLMYDGENEDIFEHFSLVAQRTEVYTARDYADIVEHLVKRWGIETLSGLSSRGQQAQEYVCNLPDRFRKLEERARAKATATKKEAVSANISWVFNRSVGIL